MPAGFSNVDQLINVVNDTIAIIIFIVAHLGEGDATLAVETIVDEAVAVIVEAVADLNGGGWAWVSGDGADSFGAINRALISACHAANSEFSVIAKGPFVFKPFVDDTVAVIVDTVALFEDLTSSDDGGEGVGKFFFGGGKEGFVGAAGELACVGATGLCNCVELGAFASLDGEANYVSFYTFGEQCSGGCRGGSLAAFDAVGQQNGCVLAARFCTIALDDGIKVIGDGLEGSGKWGGAGTTQLTVTTFAAIALGVCRGFLEVGFFVVEPREVLVEGAIKANENLGSAAWRPAGSCVINAVCIGCRPSDGDIGGEGCLCWITGPRIQRR